MSLAARKIRLIMALRRSGVTDTAVLAAIERIPREDFVPESFHDQAYEDKALPIGQGQTISQPQIVALMTQALELNAASQGAGDRHRLRLSDRRALRGWHAESIPWSATSRCCARRRRDLPRFASATSPPWPATA